MDIKTPKLRDITLKNKGIAHMVVYYVGDRLEIDGRTIAGEAGCIGCICRPDTPVLEKRFEWKPNGIDAESANFKHCIVSRTDEDVSTLYPFKTDGFRDSSISIRKQGRVRSFK